MTQAIKPCAITAFTEKEILSKYTAIWHCHTAVYPLNIAFTLTMNYTLLLRLHVRGVDVSATKRLTSPGRLIFTLRVTFAYTSLRSVGVVLRTPTFRPKTSFSRQAVRLLRYRQCEHTRETRARTHWELQWLVTFVCSDERISYIL